MEDDLKGIKRNPASGPKPRRPEPPKNKVVEKPAAGFSNSLRETKLVEPPIGLPIIDEPRTILGEPKNSAFSIEQELEPKIIRADISAKPAPTEIDDRQEARVFFEEGVSLWQRKFFQEAAGQFQKAAEHPAASFLLKKRAERLLKKALLKVDEKNTRKQQLEQKNFTAAKIPAETPVKEITPVVAPEVFFNENENQSEEPLQPITEESRLSLKRIGLVLGGLLLIAAASLAAFWFFTQKKALDPLPEVPEAPVIQPAGTPEKLLSGQFQEALNLENTTSFPGQFQESLAKETRNGFFKNVFVKKVVDYKEEWLSLDELLSLFNGQLPAEIRNRLSGGYNLLVYQQPTPDGSTPFDSQDFLASKRILLVLDISEKEGLQEALSVWENQMAQDLAPLLFFGKNTPAAENTLYQENFYRGAFIRYLNFPQPDLSLDYLIVDQMLVLATSRESTFAIIDKIMENL